MYAVPDVDEVVAVAKELGIHLGSDEAVMYRKYLIADAQCGRRNDTTAMSEGQQRILGRQ